MKTLYKRKPKEKLLNNTELLTEIFKGWGKIFSKKHKL